MVSPDSLAEELGAEWTTKKGPGTLREICANGPWGADFIPEPGAGRSGLPHTIVIDGMSENGNLRVRDPWEGTKYELTTKEFFKHWSGRAIYKKVVE